MAEGEVRPTQLLIEAGSNVNARGDLGSTPLFNAVIGENADVIKLLLKNGADPGIANDEGWYVLDYAKNISSPMEVINALQTSRYR